MRNGENSRKKLTIERIRKLKCPPDKSVVFLWDETVHRFGVRATANAKSYIVQGKIDRKTVRYKIANFGTIPLDSTDIGREGARQEAKRILALFDKGIDPRLEKKKLLAEQEEERLEVVRQQITFGEVWKLYIEDRCHGWSERHYMDHIRVSQAGGATFKRGKGKTKPGPLAPLLAMNLSDLTSSTVKKWGKKEAEKRATQTRIAFDALRAFVNWCADQEEYKGLVSQDACSSRIKADIIPKRKPKKNALQREQLPYWFSAARDYQNNVISAYLQALLLTGARRNELTNLKWTDVDFKWKSLIIHDKVEGERAIPLTPYVASLLVTLPRRNKWVFSSPGAKSGRLQEPRIPHNKILSKAGINHLTLHDLRRSFGNLAEWVEVPVGVVYQIMGHKPSATAEKHYRNRPLDLLRKWHIKIEEWVLAQAGVDMKHLGDEKFRLRLVEGGKIAKIGGENG